METRPAGSGSNCDSGIGDLRAGGFRAPDAFGWIANGWFRSGKNSFFSWLGVTMYLSLEAVMDTFKFIASTPVEGGVVFDYAVNRASLDPLAQRALDKLSGRVAAAGEPFHTFFDPAALADRLRRTGFRSVEDLGAEEINSRYFKDRSDGLSVAGRIGRLMNATI